MSFLKRAKVLLFDVVQLKNVMLYSNKLYFDLVRKNELSYRVWSDKDSVYIFCCFVGS